MADETDVQATLVSLISAALYPSGTSQASAAGVNAKVFRGWPTPNQLEDAKAQGYVHVSVFCRNGVERNTSRYPFVWQTSVPPVHTLTATVSGNQVTIGGTVSTPQNVAIVAAQQAWSYGVQPNDTLTSIATGLTALVAPSYPGSTNSGPVITLGSGIGVVQARVGGAGTSIRELKRQEKSFQISVWAPPATTVGQADLWRVNVAKVIDSALALVRMIALPDGTAGFIHYERTIDFDTAQEEGLYRRDLFYWVEYPTTQTETDYEIVVMQTQIQGEASPTGMLPIPNDTSAVNIES